MPDVTLPTPGEVAQMRERHVERTRIDYHHTAQVCAVDGQDWPCDATRLLALVDHVESANHENAKAAHRYLREAVEARARVAAVLAEVERLRAALTTARRDALTEAADAYRAAGWTTVAGHLDNRAAQEED